LLSGPASRNGGGQDLRRNATEQPTRRTHPTCKLEDISIKMTKTVLDIVVCILLALFECLLQTWDKLGLPDDDFISSWNHILWVVWSGLVTFVSTLIVLAGRVGEYRWRWMIDLIIVNVLAVYSVVVVVKVLRPAEGLLSIFMGATWFHLVPAFIGNLVVFILMILIDSWRRQR
jgi:hypothetical protein